MGIFTDDERAALKEAGENLHQALATLGIVAKPSNFKGKKEFFKGKKSLGHFNAHEGWKLVKKLRGK